MRRRVIALLALLATLALALAAASSANPPTTRVVMSGLDNPRGLAFGPNGALYVAEAGRGGTGPCFSPPIRGGQMCYGATGAISRLWHGKQERIASGLPSYANVATGEANGPHDIAFRGHRNARVSVGWAGEGLPRSVLPGVGEQFGWLYRLSPRGELRPLADLTAYEFAANPDGGLLDSNPYGILAERGGTLVADAGANALFRARANGRITTLATFPSRPQGRTTDSVPTAVAAWRGEDDEHEDDGDDEDDDERGKGRRERVYYVSELTGVPFAAGAANIYRFVPGQAPTVAYSGFTTVLDLAFGPDGSLYVLEHSTGPVFFAMPGRLLRIAPDGTRTTVIDGLTRPGSVVVARDGTIYVSNHSNAVGVGEVLQVDP
jgi:hypothetical protein